MIWGSTYLAIRIAIESVPPLLMAGVRYASAGVILLAWQRWRGDPAPSPVHWRSAAVIGALLLVGGNGAVSWSQLHVPSGLAALVIASVPLWMALLDWLRPGGRRPTASVVAGLLLGMIGLWILIGSGKTLAGTRPDPVASTVLVLGALSWSAGSLYSRHARLPASPLLGIGMEMLCGGLLLVLLGLLMGEGGRFHADHISLRSVLAFAYLVVFGALIGFTCYVWLLRVSSPAKVSTYAFVNPVVAVLLGWWLAGEVVSPRVLVSSAVIVSGVAMITLLSGRPEPSRE